MATGKETDEVIVEPESTSTSTTKDEAMQNELDLPDAVLVSGSNGASVRASNTCAENIQDVLSLGKNDCSGKQSTYNESEESKTSPLPHFKSGGGIQCNFFTLSALSSYLLNRNKLIEAITLPPEPVQYTCTNLPYIKDLIDVQPEPPSNPIVLEKLHAKVARCPPDKQTDDYIFSSRTLPLQSGCFSSVPESSDTSSNAQCTDHGASSQISRLEKEAAILPLTPTDNLATSLTNSITFHDESYDSGTSTQGGESRRKPQKRHLPEKLEPEMPTAKKPNLNYELPVLDIKDADFLL